MKMTNQTAAAEWANLTAKAEGGDIAAMITAGNALRNGSNKLSVKRDVNAGLAWLEKAANAGSLEAMRTLVGAYERLSCAGRTFNFGASKRADEWRRKLRQTEEALVANGARSVAEITRLGKGKKRIGRNTYENRLDLVNLEIANGVVAIGQGAFSGCSRLCSVKFPASLRKIEKGAFLECTSLRNVEFRYGIETIAPGAFIGCPIEKLVLPDSLTDLPRNAFDKSVVVPDCIARVWEAENRHEIEKLKVQAHRDAEREREEQARREAEAKRKEEEEKDREPEREAAHKAFSEKYGIAWESVEYSCEPSFDGWAGCRIQRPAAETISVEIPEKFRLGNERELVARIASRGSTKAYSVVCGGDEGTVVETYALQRDARKSRYWPVFAALSAYKKFR